MSRRRPHNGSSRLWLCRRCVSNRQRRDQILGAHIFGVRIARALHFAGDLNRAGLDTESVFVNQEAVAGCSKMLSAASPFSAEPRFTLKILELPSGLIRKS